MKKNTVLKTMTLGHDDNPGIVICPGHVNAKTFNKAFRAEGWSGDGTYKQDDLQYVYCKATKMKNGTRYTKVTPEHKDAKPFTWTSWD